MTVSKSKDLTLHDLFVMELKDAYDAEHQLTKALTVMAGASTHPDLKKAFLGHLEETKGQITMLDTVFTGMKLKPEGKHCDGIAGIITEGDGTIRDITKSTVLDAGLVAGGRRAEHYEIAAYRALIAMGQALGYTEACTTLGKILKEEEAADSKLTGLGVTLNKAAALEVSAHV